MSILWLGVLAILVASLWIAATLGSVKRRFEREARTFFRPDPLDAGVFTPEDVAKLPEPVRRYFDHCGLLGQPKIMWAEVVWPESAIRMQPKGPWLPLQTQQYNAVNPPMRLAFMHARLGGVIPFDGRDQYVHGQGHMLGKIAGLYPVFNEKDHAIAQSALITILAEALIVPAYALQPFIQWEAVDQYTAKARIQTDGLDVSGLFHFDEAGALTHFTSEDRLYLSPQGSVKRPFMVEVTGYRTSSSQQRMISEVAASWILDEGKYTYWKGSIASVNAIATLP